MTPAVGADPTTIAARIGYTFRDPGVLTLALRHRSYCAENLGTESNERLELLGDSVVGLAVTDHLYGLLPGRDEGELAKIRAAVVSTGSLAAAASGIDLGAALHLGRGEARSGGRRKESILADGFEALVGAVFIDGGFEAARRVVLECLAGRLDAAVEGPDGDYKTRLQELASRRFERTPVYTLTESGPEHDKAFHATVLIDERPLGHGSGRSKKRAEQAAAHAAWLVLTAGDDVAHGNTPMPVCPPEGGAPTMPVCPPEGGAH
jgi:ribonuclease-3